MTADRRVSFFQVAAASPWTRFATVLLFLWLFAAPVVAAAKSDGTHVLDLFARGQEQRYWVALVLTDGPVQAPRLFGPAYLTSPSRGKTYTDVRLRDDPIRGTWSDVARLGLRVTAATPLGDQLAVLTERGEWRLLWPGGSVVGAPPPGGLVPVDLASSGSTLFAVCGPSESAATTQPNDSADALWRWTESAGWSRVAALPAGLKAADFNGDATLGAFSGDAWLAWPDGDGLRVARFDGRAWVEPVGRLMPMANPQFVDNAPVATLAGVRGEKLALWHLSGPDASPVPLRSVALADGGGSFGLSDVAAVGPTLRIVSVDNAHLVQTAVDDAGRGPVQPPTVLPDTQAAGPTRNDYNSPLVLALLTVLTLATLRPRPEVTRTLAAAAAWPA